MKNRYGDEYHFTKLTDNEFTIVGGLKYWRYGGREGQTAWDWNDLGFVDPSGGPFIELGTKIEGRNVKRIRVSGDYENQPIIIFEVE